MESVGVFDFDKGNIGEHLIGPCERDAPFRGADIGIGGISLGALQFVVMERMKGKEIFFGGMVQDEEAFLSFIEADAAQMSGFFLGHIFAEKNPLGECIGEALDHRVNCNLKRERGKGNQDVDGCCGAAGNH